MHQLFMKMAILVFSLLGLDAPSFAQEVTFPTSKDEFSIGFWWGPPAHLAHSRDVWRTAAEAGFNFCHSRPGYDLKANLDMHSHCSALGLSSLIMDEKIAPTLTQTANWQTILAQTIDTYRKVGSNFGFLLKDEPHRREFEALSTIDHAIRAYDPHIFTMTNLFPTYASAAQLGFSSYRDYVDIFANVAKPRVLLFDYYPFIANGIDRQGYFDNLGIVRDAASRGNIPFGLYLQAWAFEALRQPTEGELRWQVFGALAYGAKSIIYFTFWPDPTSGTSTAIVDAEGVPTATFPIVQNINRTVKGLGRKLLKLVSRRVRHSGSTPLGAHPLEPDAEFRVTNNAQAVFGFFLDPQTNETFVLIANRDYLRTTTMTLAPSSRSMELWHIDPISLAETQVVMSGGHLTISLAPGDGALFRYTH